MSSAKSQDPEPGSPFRLKSTVDELQGAILKVVEKLPLREMQHIVDLFARLHLDVDLLSRFAADTNRTLQLVQQREDANSDEHDRYLVERGKTIARQLQTAPGRRSQIKVEADILIQAAIAKWTSDWDGKKPWKVSMAIEAELKNGPGKLSAKAIRNHLKKRPLETWEV